MQPVPRAVLVEVGWNWGMLVLAPAKQALHPTSLLWILQVLAMALPHGSQRILTWFLALWQGSSLTPAPGSSYPLGVSGPSHLPSESK